MSKSDKRIWNVYKEYIKSKCTRFNDQSTIHWIRPATFKWRSFAGRALTSHFGSLVHRARQRTAWATRVVKDCTRKKQQQFGTPHVASALNIAISCSLGPSYKSKESAGAEQRFPRCCSSCSLNAAQILITAMHSPRWKSVPPDRGDDRRIEEGKKRLAGHR